MGFLRKSPEGTHIGQIKDAYLSVTADITRLQKEVILFWGPGAAPASLGLFAYHLLQELQEILSSFTSAKVGGIPCWLNCCTRGACLKGYVKEGV